MLEPDKDGAGTYGHPVVCPGHTNWMGAGCHWRLEDLRRLRPHTTVLREAWATLPESSSRPLPATLAQSRNLAHASLETLYMKNDRPGTNSTELLTGCQIVLFGREWISYAQPQMQLNLSLCIA